MEKDVHTEHCCVIHGCKYGEEGEGCTVFDCFDLQSHLCESCDYEGNTMEDIKKFFEDHKKERQGRVEEFFDAFRE